jgi:hypothetical protein
VRPMARLRVRRAAVCRRATAAQTHQHLLIPPICRFCEPRLGSMARKENEHEYVTEKMYVTRRKDSRYSQSRKNAW